MENRDLADDERAGLGVCFVQRPSLNCYLMLAPCLHMFVIFLDFNESFSSSHHHNLLSPVSSSDGTTVSHANDWNQHWWGKRNFDFLLLLKMPPGGNLQCHWGRRVKWRIRPKIVFVPMSEVVLTVITSEYTYICIWTSCSISWANQMRENTQPSQTNK